MYGLLNSPKKRTKCTHDNAFEIGNPESLDEERLRFKHNKCSVFINLGIIECSCKMNYPPFDSLIAIISLNLCKMNHVK